MEALFCDQLESWQGNGLLKKGSSFVCTAAYSSKYSTSQDVLSTTTSVLLCIMLGKVLFAQKLLNNRILLRLSDDVSCPGFCVVCFFFKCSALGTSKTVVVNILFIMEVLCCPIPQI